MANGVMEEERVDRSEVTGPTNEDASRAEIYEDIQAASHPVLPSKSVVAYLDEGAANIVYTLSVPSPHEDPSRSYQDAFPKVQRRADELGFWDGILSFCSTIHVSFHFSGFCPPLAHL